MSASSGDSRSSGRTHPVRAAGISVSSHGRIPTVSGVETAISSRPTPTERPSTRSISPAARYFSRSRSTPIRCSVSTRLRRSSIEPTKRFTWRSERRKPRFSAASLQFGSTSTRSSMDQRKSTNLVGFVRATKDNIRRGTAVLAAARHSLAGHAGGGVTVSS